MSNVAQSSCAVCSGPGMTQFESGKWLCKRHSPYTGPDKTPQHNEYLKQKGVELSCLMLGIVKIVSELTKEHSMCPICNNEHHDESCPVFKLGELCEIKTLNHPLAFFSLLEKLEPACMNQFLQDANIVGFPNIYTPDEYLVLEEETTAKARFLSKLIGSASSLLTIPLEVVMELPGRIGYTHTDKFKGLPLQERPEDSSYTPCQTCLQHGFWNLHIIGTGGRHLVQKCHNCGGLGWISPKVEVTHDITPLNWYFDTKHSTYVWSYAHPSEAIGLLIRKARISSKIAPAEFATKVSEFLGKEYSSSNLIGVENGNMPAYDSLYTAVGYVSNTVLTSFRK